MKRSKALLINPSGWVRDNVNLGLSHLAAALKAADYSCQILDLNLFPLSEEQLIEEVKTYNPSFIGVSVKTATSNEGARVATFLKKHFPEKIFVAGGPHVTIAAREYMNAFPAFDYGVMSEGEVVIVEMMNAMEESTSLDSIRGLVHRSGDKVVVNPWSPPQKLDELPYPDFGAIKNFDWKSANFFYPILSSRGCPYECIFCCVPDLAGSRKWRSRSVKSFVDEMEFAYKTGGIKHFEIWDDNFTLHLPRAKQICRDLIDRKLPVTWACHNGIRADRLDDELAGLMREAGCIRVAFGIESGNSGTFDKLKKGEPLQAVVDAVAMVKRAGIDAIGYFIIGLPGDTLSSFIETIRFQRSLGLTEHLFGMLVPYPMTEVWDIVSRDGKFLMNITGSMHYLPNDAIAPISFEMPGFPKEDMEKAYYISRSFPIYEATDRVRGKGLRPMVAFQGSERMASYLEGFVRACAGPCDFLLVSQGELSHTLNALLKQRPEIQLVDRLPLAERDRLVIVGDLPFGLAAKEFHFKSESLSFTGKKGCLLEEKFLSDGTIAITAHDLPQLAKYFYRNIDKDLLWKLKGHSEGVEQALDAFVQASFDPRVVEDWLGRELLVHDLAVGVGFDKVERADGVAWRWALGSQQQLRFLTSSPGAYRLLLKAMVPMKGTQLSLQIEGKDAIKINTTSEKQLIEEEFVFICESSKEHMVEFSVSKFNGANGRFSEDQRPLAYSVVDFKLLKMSESLDGTLIDKSPLDYRERAKLRFRNESFGRL